MEPVIELCCLGELLVSSDLLGTGISALSVTFVLSLDYSYKPLALYIYLYIVVIWNFRLGRILQKLHVGQEALMLTSLPDRRLLCAPMYPNEHATDLYLFSGP